MTVSGTRTDAGGGNGLPGADGLSVYSFPRDPLVSEGRDGETAVNTVTGDVFKKAGGSWGSPIGNLTGPQGLQGPKGDPGTGGGGSASARPWWSVRRDMPIGSRPINSYGQRGAAGERGFSKLRIRLPLGAGVVKARFVGAATPGAGAVVPGPGGGTTGGGGFDDPDPSPMVVRCSLKVNRVAINSGATTAYYFPFYFGAAEGIDVGNPDSVDKRRRGGLLMPGADLWTLPLALDLDPWASSIDDVYLLTFVEPTTAAGVYDSTAIPQWFSLFNESGKGEFVRTGLTVTDTTLGGEPTSSIGTFFPAPWAVYSDGRMPYRPGAADPFNRAVVGIISDSIGDSVVDWPAQWLADEYPCVTTGRPIESGSSDINLIDTTEYRRRLLRDIDVAIIQKGTNDSSTTMQSGAVGTGFGSLVDRWRRLAREAYRRGAHRVFVAPIPPFVWWRGDPAFSVQRTYTWTVDGSGNVSGTLDDATGVVTGRTMWSTSKTGPIPWGAHISSVSGTTVTLQTGSGNPAPSVSGSATVNISTVADYSTLAGQVPDVDASGGIANRWQNEARRQEANAFLTAGTGVTNGWWDGALNYLSSIQQADPADLGGPGGTAMLKWRPLNPSGAVGTPPTDDGLHPNPTAGIPAIVAFLNASYDRRALLALPD